MPVFIAKNYEGKTVDMVLSHRRDLAEAYWHGKGVYPHSVNEYTLDGLKDHPTGVLPLLSTREREVRNKIGTRNETVLIVE